MCALNQDSFGAVLHCLHMYDKEKRPDQVQLIALESL